MGTQKFFRDNYKPYLSHSDNPNFPNINVDKLIEYIDKKNININEIIQEEYYIYMIEKECGLLTEVYGSERAQAVASSKVLRPTQISPVDKYPGFEQVLADC